MAEDPKLGEIETRTAFLGRTPEEQKEFESTVKGWQEEGFDLIPGTRAAVVFQLVRVRLPVQESKDGAMGIITIDDKLVIHRDKDGTRLNADRTPYIEMGTGTKQ